jgi:hypothetical protein
MNLDCKFRTCNLCTRIGWLLDLQFQNLQVVHFNGVTFMWSCKFRTWKLWTFIGLTFRLTSLDIASSALERVDFQNSILKHICTYICSTWRQHLKQYSVPELSDRNRNLKTWKRDALLQKCNHYV